MRILIFLFLFSSCLINYGNAADNTNQIKSIPADSPSPGDATARKRRLVHGGQKEQDPNDPKYQKMANELVRNNLRIKEEDIQNIKVNRVTTQVVAGICTRIEIRITLVSGISDQCNFKVWEKPWENVKHVTYRCLTLSSQKLLTGNSGSPRPEQIRDPKDPKYHKLAKASIDYLLNTPEHKLFEKQEVDRIYVTNVKAQVGTKINNHIHFYLVTVNNKTFKCTSNITETPWNPEEKENVTEVICSSADEQSPPQMLQNLNKPIGTVLKLTKTNPGGQVYEKPWDPKYKTLAKAAFQKYQLAHNLNINVKSIMVNSVTSQVVSGIIYRINFFVYSTKDDLRIYKCHSKTIKMLNKAHSEDIHVDCTQGETGEEEEQDPKDPQFKELAELSFERYQNLHKYPEVHVKSIKVNKVTLQVVAGTNTRIEFLVYPTNGNTYRCQSKIFRPLGPDPKLNFNVSCVNTVPGGEVDQDPNDPKYQELAKISFEWYENSPKNIQVKVKRIKVNRVTTQVVAGEITRIYFRVIPITGNPLACFSKIFDSPLASNRDIKFNVSCNLIHGAEVEEDPDDPQYQPLAKESFQWYLIRHKNVKAHVKSIKINRVTSQLVAGIIVRIHFRVHPTRGSEFKCYSKIFKGLGPHPNLDFDVICDTVNGGEVEEDPDDPQYQKLAKESFQWYLNSHKNVKVHVKSIKIDSVTSQVVAGEIIRMHFLVHPTRGSIFECKSKIDKGLGPTPNIVFHVNCDTKIGGEVEEDPDDPQYQPLAKDSFQWYLNSQHMNVGVKSLKINSVTSQVVAGTILRMYFRVHPTRGSMFMCRSKIYKALGPVRNVRFDVSCDRILNGEVEEDPDDPQYKKLAQESFLWYQKSHKNIGYAKSIEINSVTSQIVAGTIIRIHFGVLPSRGSRLKCYSKIFESLGSTRKLDFEVSCNGYNGGEEEQDPDEPQFLQLAKESFRKYEETHDVPLIATRKMQVTRATTQIVAGVITRINFDVITTKGVKYMCYSTIFEQAWKDHKSIKADCNPVYTGGNKKLSLKLSSMSKTENFVNKAIKKYFRNADASGFTILDRCETMSVGTVTTRVAKQRITYYQVDAFTHTLKGDYTIFNCSVLTGSWFGKKPVSTNCIKLNWLLGRKEWADPTNKKYLSYAEKSLQLYLKNSSEIVGPRDYTKYDIIVTFVVLGHAAGYIYNINFLARWVHDRDDDPTVLLCRSKNWEKPYGKYEILDVKCSMLSWDRNRS